MRKRQFKLTKEQTNELHLAYDKSQPGQLQLRIRAILSYGNGCDAEEIMSNLGCSHQSLTEWCVRYKQHGVAGLLNKSRGRNRPSIAESLKA